MTDPHAMAKIIMCTSAAELKGLLDALRSRGVVLTKTQTMCAKIRQVELLADEKRSGWRR